MSTIASTAVHNRLREISMRCYALIPIKYRMSQKYWQIKKFLKKSQWWDQDKIHDWQLQRLKQIIKYSYTHVPGYYFLQKERGVRPEEIQKLEDLKHLPFMTKEL